MGLAGIGLAEEHQPPLFVSECDPGAVWCFCGATSLSPCPVQQRGQAWKSRWRGISQCPHVLLQDKRCRKMPGYYTDLEDRSHKAVLTAFQAEQVFWRRVEGMWRAGPWDSCVTAEGWSGVVPPSGIIRVYLCGYPRLGVQRVLAHWCSLHTRKFLNVHGVKVIVIISILNTCKKYLWEEVA